MAFRGLLSKPHLTGKFASNGLASFWGARAATSSNHHITVQQSSLPHNIISTHPIQHQQIRNKWTKTKLRQREKMINREQRIARGLPAKPNPPKYIPKDRPVINALSREERDSESRKFDEAASEELKSKIAKQAESEENLRHQFDGLQMSDRVRRLFDLKNGSQKEVVNSQKRRGMELFQLREGDTGSSAVQVVALTTRIQQLQTHMAKHHKDNSTKRGLDALYVRRRKVLDYMERKDFQSYRKVVKSLGLVR
ncbi:hypothetical protein ACHAXH_003718 [Discostella pseudostelligera]